MVAGQEGNEAWDGRRIRELRRRLGVSQQALARQLGVRQQTISEWEQGLYTPRGASKRVLTLAEQGASYVTETTADTAETSAMGPATQAPRTRGGSRRRPSPNNEAGEAGR